MGQFDKSNLTNVQKPTTLKHVKVRSQVSTYLSIDNDFLPNLTSFLNFS